jgi:hypothetical protein
LLAENRTVWWFVADSAFSLTWPTPRDSGSEDVAVKEEPLDPSEDSVDWGELNSDNGASMDYSVFYR